MTDGGKKGKLGCGVEILHFLLDVTIAELELMHFNFQFRPSHFYTGVIVEGHVGDPSEVCMSLRAPCRLWDEATAPYIILWQPIGHASDWQPRLMQNDTQIRSQDPIGLAFLISRRLCSPQFKSFSIYKFCSWSRVNQSTCGIWVSLPWKWFIGCEFSLCFYWRE